MEKAKKGDFVELTYTGKIKDTDEIFDTNDETLAKAEGVDIENPQARVGKAVICLGEAGLLRGLEDKIVGKDIPGEYTIELQPEEAFGKKDIKLIQLIPTNRFRKENINPVPGMQVTVDDQPATIKSVSGGRTLVDLNHPLSGKVVVYDIKTFRIAKDDKEKLDVYLKEQIGMNVETTLAEGKAVLKIPQEIPKEVQELLSKKIQSVIPNIKSIEFESPKKEAKPKNTEEKKTQSESSDKQ